ncbi:MAG: type II secretion system protein [bacterium]
MHTLQPVRKPLGFTLIELLVVITIIGILAAIALPNYIKAKDKAKEVQMKSAVHSIQIAVERYHTDFEQYPQYLLGGDREGWRDWHFKYNEPNPDNDLPANAWLQDILLENAYLDAYPKNPFVDNGTSVIQQTGLPTGTGGSYQVGDGDPRFGFRGDNMGNGLELPITFRNWFGNTDLNVETERSLTTVCGGNVQQKGFAGPDDNPPGLHYTMGGRRSVATENGQQVLKTVYTHWPGNFFYRGLGLHWVTRKGYTLYIPTTFVKAEIDRYMMGGYGAYTTEGKDVVRMEDTSNTGGGIYYRFPPPWQADNTGWRCSFDSRTNNPGGLPEICGGGNNTTGPWYPYNRSVDYPNSFIYGSPDGFPDAIAIVLTAGEEVTTY